MVGKDERVFVIECNPRMSAATPQVLHVPELLPGVRAGAAFLEGFLGRRTFPREVSCAPMPDTSYDGGTLDLVSLTGGIVQRGDRERALRRSGTAGSRTSRPTSGGSPAKPSSA